MIDLSQDAYIQTSSFAKNIQTMNEMFHPGVLAKDPTIVTNRGYTRWWQCRQEAREKFRRALSHVRPPFNDGGHAKVGTLMFDAMIHNLHDDFLSGLSIEESRFGSNISRYEAILNAFPPSDTSLISYFKKASVNPLPQGWSPHIWHDKDELLKLYGDPKRKWLFFDLDNTILFSFDRKDISYPQTGEAITVSTKRILRPGVDEIISEAKKRDFSIGLYTGGNVTHLFSTLTNLTHEKKDSFIFRDGHFTQADETEYLTTLKPLIENLDLIIHRSSFAELHPYEVILLNPQTDLNYWRGFSQAGNKLATLQVFKTLPLGFSNRAILFDDRFSLIRTAQTTLSKKAKLDFFDGVQSSDIERYFDPELNHESILIIVERLINRIYDDNAALIDKLKQS